MSAKRTTKRLNNSPRTLINGFSDSAVVGSLLFQWGQDVSSSDKAQKFIFPVRWPSRNHTMLTNISFKNVKSCLPIGAWSSTSFTIDRHGDIDGHQPFYWMAVGEAPKSASKAVRTGGYRTLSKETGAVIQWGKQTSSLDTSQKFKLAKAMNKEGCGVFTCAAKGNAKWGFATHKFDPVARQFFIDRANGIDGKVPFHSLAIGYLTEQKGSRNDAGIFHSPESGGFLLQWGRAQSTSDFEEVFPLNTAFGDMNFSVFITMADSNMPYGLSLTRPVNTHSFIVDRDSAVNGRRSFYWLAIGRPPR